MAATKTKTKSRWSLATLIFLLTALLIMGVVGLSVGVGVFQGQRFADEAVDEALDRAAVTQLDFERLRAREIELIAEGLAKDDDFVAYIEEALGTGDLFGDSEVDRVSIADQLSERRAERDLDLAVLLDADGRPVARTDRQVRADESFDDDPLVAELVAELTPLSAIWRDGDELYQVAMQPLDRSQNLIGFLLLGQRIDSQLADEMKRATGADQMWLTDGVVVASTLTTAATARALEALQQGDRLAAMLGGQAGAYRVPLRLERGRWMASIEPIGLDEETAIAAVVSLVSLDNILASHRRLWQILIAVGLGAVLLGLLLSLALSRRVVRPLSQLALAAAAASKGDYQQEFEATGSDETERLGSAFKSLLSDLREKRDMEEYVADLSRYLPDPAAEQSATSRTGPAVGRPARDELALLALDYRHLVNLEGAAPEDNVRRFQSSLSQIAALAEALDARLESFSGHRALVGFGGEQAVAHALEFAGHVSEHLSEVPSMALVIGVVDRGMVRAGFSSAEVLIGKASHQVDLLLEEAQPGKLLFSPAVKQAAAAVFEPLGIEPGVQSGRLSGRKYHALGTEALTRLAAEVSDQTRKIEAGDAESVIETVAQSREIVPGDVFAGRFEIIAVLGQGGMGMVYKALDRELEDFVALKTLLPELAGDEKYLQQLKEEIKLARKITHPNVLRTFDFGSHEGVAYISMEYVRGMTLRYLMRQRSRLPYSAGLRISRQTCAGLAAAHSQDVVHRDVKPENIILKANGNAKLMDFGIARPTVVAEGEEGIGVFVGTALYAAPEQMEGQRVDARADVYALGVLMYELFGGAAPYHHDDLMELYKAKKNGSFEPLTAAWSEAPMELSAVVTRCMLADPDGRYRDAEELGEALSRLRA